MDNVVNLHPYNPFWRVFFLIEHFRLQCILHGQVLGIAHVGSTSIPHMPAKPVIDISIAIPTYEHAWTLIETLKATGYSYLGENAALRQYSFEKRHPYACALYLCEPGGEKWEKRLCFRNALRTHPGYARAYAGLKQRLARQYAYDLPAYQRAKLAFVQEICELAENQEI